MSGTKKLQTGHYLFREGDASDAMYVVKSGRLAVTKSKQNSEIVLAEIGPGSMVGEMAFFDNKPRSANVKAIQSTEVIALPFKGLHAQFANFPEWAKAIMRTVNNHIREANKRIKELEKVGPEAEMFPPHVITKLTSIINFVGLRYGKIENGEILVPYTTLRNYTIQIFQEPTHKLDKLMGAYSNLEFLRVDDLGEGRKRVAILQADLLFSFVEWYNDWLFKREDDRITITEDELKILKGVIHFARRGTADAKGRLKLNLTEMQNDSMRELNVLIKTEEVNCLIDKHLMTEMMTEEAGLFSYVELEACEKMAPYWDIIYSLKKIVK